MPFSIRQASGADSPGIVDVIRAVFDEYEFTWEPEGYHADLYALDAHYDGVCDRFFVAEIEGRIVGTIALETFEPIPGVSGSVPVIDGFYRVAGSDCSLERLYVHPDARRQGVGQALTEHIIALAQAEGRKQMEIWSDKRFGDAHRLYGRFGAAVVGDRICHDPDQSPEWGLAIPLA
ncbi:MAG: GNAT family N-acetyltransferase [Fimbriimonas sp.]|nr:GNAT family N-acetyltransferase [Fimbriimonas sp.]